MIGHNLRLKFFGAPLALLVSCLCLSARANQLTDNLTIVGGTVVEQGDDVVITYTAEQIAKEGGGKLEFKAGQATARVLAIGGGGGGGGTLGKDEVQWGAGGGGGAGGFVEASGLGFSGTYIISVGAGGAKVAANTHGEGGDGGSTTIQKDGAQVAGIAIALGGGGGGAGGSEGQTQTTVTTPYSGKGRKGGSGGGGSQTYKNSSYSYKKAGGAGTTGQGNKGGGTTVNNTSYWIGAGGGGAGGAGTDVATSTQTGGAPGGAGKVSDITGSSVTYASGGAGGAIKWSGIGKVAAVAGGGGSGGTDENTDSRDGLAGTGGGGGGASSTLPSGCGGSGVLIIRLSGYIAGGVVVPTIPDYVYDGTVKKAVADTAYYTVSGENEKTAAGTYTITLTLTEAGKKVGWDDKYVGDSRDVKWSIAQKPIEKPTPVATRYVYDPGNEQTGFTNGTWYTVSGDFKATDAGTYTPTATLNDSANTKWADGATNPRSDLTWTIEKKPIDKPDAMAKTWVYTGNVQTGFVENVEYYTFDDKNRSVNAGTFIPTAELVDTKNTKWADGASDSRSDFTWTMAPHEVKKPTAVEGLVFNAEVRTGSSPASATEYTLSGHQQTNAGDYQFTAHLNNPAGVVNYKWLYGESDDLVIDWSIAKMSVNYPQTLGTTPTYTYDGTVKTPFGETAWYKIVEGTGSESAAGTYTCTLRLNYNNESVTNVVWQDGASEDASWTWKIEAKVVTIPSATTFVYDENPKGTPVERTMLIVPGDADWKLDVEKSQDLTQKDARKYGYVVQLKDPENTVWSNGSTQDQTITCEIKKVENEIQNFTMRDWQAGSTESQPYATIKFGTTIKFDYSDEATGPWDSTKRTANGYHYVRASAPGSLNWNATESILRYCVWTHPSEVFSDFVDIKASGYTGSTALTDFPVLVRIREAVKDSTGAVTGGLPGFTYARAGDKGENIRFLSAGDKKINDQLLPYEIEKWDVTGESLVWVKLPKLSGKATTFRMYWHTDDPKSANDPTLVWSTYKKGDSKCDISKAANFFTFELVNVEGVWTDYWTTRPSMTKSTWAEGEITEADITKGALKKNNPVLCQYVTMPGEKTTNTVIQTQGGIYRIVCDMTPPTDGEKYSLFDGVALLDYTVVGVSPEIEIGGTDEGRILLANNDSREDHPITGQGYYETDPTLPTFWWHDAATPDTAMRFLRTGANHILYQRTASGASNVLWRASKVWLGSWYSNRGALASYRNYLPCSETALPKIEPGVPISLSNVTHIVFHNTPEAVLYSPCYTNGIGTIYFDAVNGEVADNNALIIVEVATETSRGAPPTDENCRFEDDPFFYLTHNKEGAELPEAEDMWKPVSSHVLKKQKGSAVFVHDTAATNGLAPGQIKLAIQNGGADDVFYRIAAQVKKAGTLRFRIKRVKKSGSGYEDSSCLILLDNIVVSKPPMGANLSAVGEYDPDLSGKQTLGQACGLDRPFPAWTESGIRARAKIEYITNGEKADTSKFVASARFNYRWRYLNQTFVPEKLNDQDQWTTLYLDHNDIQGGVFTTVRPLEFARAVGDVEWYYDMTLQAPMTRYIDYSGLKFDKPVGDYIESPSAVTNRMTIAEGDRLASGGKNWFVRLREGKSDWQGMQVVIDSVGTATNVTGLVGAHDMELIGDNMWRVFVSIPTNAEGTCSFIFRGNNLQTGSPMEIEKNTKTFGLTSAGQTAAIPANGTLTENGYPVHFTIDHAAGYLEFRVSDRYKTFQVGRAEYQNFNYWNDAHKKVDQFCINSVDTNSVDVANMKISKAPMNTWPLFISQDHKHWDEWFEVGDYAPTEGRFMKNIFHQSHETPNSDAWSAQNITFVSERFVKSDVTVQKKESGMAGKLLGNADGLMDFSYADAPLGLEKITLNARLGQSDLFNAFAYCRRSYADDNYMLFVPVTMSHATAEDGSASGDMAVGASVSLVGYHTDSVGCYEARCERLFAGKTIRLSLWKWTYQDQKYVSTQLLSHDFEQICWSEESGAEKERKFYGMFLSFETAYADEEEATSTKIICGLSTANRIVYDKEKIYNVEAPWKSFDSVVATNKNVKWNGLIYNDTKNPHGYGCYGMTSKDCYAQMVMPAHSTTPYIFTAEKKDIEKNVSWYYSGQKLSFSNTFDDDRDDLNPKKRFWTTKPGRTECFTNYNAKTYRWIGLHAPTNVTQNLDLYLKPRGTSEQYWELVSKSNDVTVSGYGFQTKSFDLKRPGQWDVRLRTGSAKAVDVVVDAITLHKWQADDKPTHSESAFFYTQCVVVTNEAKKTNFTRLQPARADETRALSIRSPLMQGLGKITFNYTDVAKNAELWVQVATNAVHGNMDRNANYNDSIKSVELGEPEPRGTWITVAKYKYDAAGAEGYESLGASGTRSVYLGWHSHPQRPLQGLFRLFVPTNVVVAAQIASTNKTQNVGYGQLTITDVSCSDEPGFSDRSWRGWNMRTIGNAGTTTTPADEEKRMNLIDMKIEDGGTGLVGALNNSVNDVYENGELVTGKSESWERLKASFPAIYSPLMHPINRRSGVGSVTFKARLYSTTGVPTVEGSKGGKITIYGSNDPTASGGWTPLATHEIVGSVFSNYTWTAGGELYTAVKLEIDDPSARTQKPEVERIVLDEIVIGEKVPPTINFEYARPFRNNLFTKEPIADIMSPAEQPLAGESWGVQTKLSLQQLTDEIDIEKGLEVYFSYKRGTNPWGHGNWTSASEPVKLVQVGDASNLVFRSVGETPQSLVEPAAKGGEVVQFILKVKYYDRGGKSDEITMGSDWVQPSWFYPLDYNEEKGGYDDEKNFAAYTVLDSVSPGRAWINEVNWNDGTEDEWGGKACVTNQFVEICIPSGVDMSGWQLRLTDYSEYERVFAVFGDASRGIPAKKVSATAVNGYEFFVLQSPATQKAGGIHYPGATTSAADATWYSDTLGRDVKNGKLDFAAPYQFELIRPSGIIEHQFVLDGTNTLSEFDWAKIYDGTNLVAKLNESDSSPLRFYAGHEVARKADRKTLASIGVTRGEASEDTANWPGGKNTWTEGMGFTPGRINENQVIPKNWFIAPNGTNNWVYFLIDTDHVSQKVGAETSRSILAVVPQGKSTNVTYSVDNWFEADICLNDKPVMTGCTGAGIKYTFSPTGTTYVTAAAQPQKKLASEFGLDANNPYSQAVLNWLQKKYGNASADDIRLAWFVEFPEVTPTSMMPLTEMYWLDIPPVPVTEEEKAMNGGTNWYFCAGIDGWGKDHYITRERAGKTVTYTNKQVEVTMYASNACTLAKWAPYTLQGLNNELSSEFGGVWTSATFKIKGKLNLMDPKQTFLPFRVFTFGTDSFAGPEGDQTIGLKPFTARIDILDPFQSPIGMNYDWHTRPNSEAYFKWSLDEKEYPYTTEKLKADSTYPETL